MVTFVFDEGAALVNDPASRRGDSVRQPRLRSMEGRKCPEKRSGCNFRNCPPGRLDMVDISLQPDSEHAQLGDQLHQAHAHYRP